MLKQPLIGQHSSQSQKNSDSWEVSEHILGLVHRGTDGTSFCNSSRIDGALHHDEERGDVPEVSLTSGVSGY